jgi:hypothetical protein
MAKIYLMDYHQLKFADLLVIEMWGCEMGIRVLGFQSLPSLLVIVGSS